MGKLRDWFIEKLNPAQPEIAKDEGSDVSSFPGYATFAQAFNDVEVVNRGTSLVINGAVSFDYNVAEKLSGITPVVNGLRKAKINALLNYQPNPYQDIQSFRKQCFMDFLLEGNIFIYYDGAYLYHLPAIHVEIHPDPKTLVAGYTYNSTIKFNPEEIIHIKDNSSSSMYRGSSRLQGATASLKTRKKMMTFQDTFFTNGAVPGLVLQTDSILGDRIKQRLIESWQREYNPTKGGKRPLILDGGLKLDRISEVNFTELDFEASIDGKDDDILMALGVPSILLKGGNNANISPNLRLFYLETVLPIVRAVCSAFERYFGYNIEVESAKVSALQPDMKEASQFYTTLVNGGVITPNEAREELRYEPKEGADDLRVPANIAGSAANPGVGGKPTTGPKDGK